MVKVVSSECYLGFNIYVDFTFSKVFGKRTATSTAVAKSGSSVSNLAAQRAARELAVQ